MKQWKNKQTLTAVAITFILVIGALIYGMVAGTVKTEKNNIVFFGDSIIGNDRTESSVTSQLSKLTGMSIYNAGIGGTKLSKGNPETVLLDRYNMMNLARTVETKDFTSYLSTNLSKYFELNDVISYAGDTIKNLAKVDFDYADIIIIEQGVNDFLDCVPATNKENPSDEKTIEGALRSILTIFKEKYPDKKLIVVSPGYFDIEAGCAEELDMGFGRLEDFILVEKQVCEEQNVEFIDFYHDGGIDASNYTEYLKDGLHTNEKGNERLALLLAEVINGQK